MKKEINEAISIVLFYWLIVLIVCVLIITCCANSEAQGWHIEAENIPVEELKSQFEEQEVLGAKFSRYQIYTSMKDKDDNQTNREEFLRRVGWQADKLEDVIQNRSVFVIIDLHDCPVKFPDICLEAAEYLYLRFNPYYRFIGIDINEPSWPNYLTFAQKFIDLTARVAPNKFAFVESLRGSPRTISQLKKLKGNNWIASVHVYWPMPISHQGVLQYKDKPYLWGRDFTKKQLENYLKPVVKFQKDTGKNIYIGESSCVRWSGYPKYSNAQFWIRDAISIFNKHNWSWTVTSFRGNNIWSSFLPWDRNNNTEYPTTWVMEEIKKGFKQ